MSTNKNIIIKIVLIKNFKFLTKTGFRKLLLKSAMGQSKLCSKEGLSTISA